MNFIKILALFLISSIFYSGLKAEKIEDLIPVSIKDSIDYYPIGTGMIFLQDTHRDYSFSSIIEHPENDNFIRKKREGYNLGFSDSFYWFAVKLRNESSSKNWLLGVEFPLLSKIEFYLVQKGNLIKFDVSGYSIDSTRKKVISRHYYFPMELDPGEDYLILLKVESLETIQFTPYIVSEPQYIQRERSEQIYFGVYFGIIIAMVLYNLILYFTIRDITYLYYVLFLISIGLFTLSQNGFVMEYLNISPLTAIHLNPILANFGTFFGSYFVSHFLNTKKFAYSMHRILRLTRFLSPVGILLSIFGSFTVAVFYSSTVALIFSLVAISAGWVCFRNGYGPALSYLFAWGIFLTSIIIFDLRSFGVVPNNSFTQHGILFGSTIEMIILSVSLGFRIDSLRREKEKAEFDIVLSRHKLDTLSKELNIASKIQKSILPSQMPEIMGVTSHVFYKPMMEVGGDYYDYHLSRDGKGIGFIIGDVSGHGVPASIIASMMKIAFTEQRLALKMPSELLEGMNLTLYGKSNRSLMTAAYVYIDTARKVFHFATAGHPPILHYQRSIDSLSEINVRGKILGLAQDIKYSSVEIPYQLGDRLILYTDGITECRNQKGEMPEEKVIFEFIRRNCRNAVSDLLLSLEKFVRDWSSDKEMFADDVTILVIELE